MLIPILEWFNAFIRVLYNILSVIGLLIAGVACVSLIIGFYLTFTYLIPALFYSGIIDNKHDFTYHGVIFGIITTTIITIICSILALYENLPGYIEKLKSKEKDKEICK